MSRESRSTQAADRGRAPPSCAADLELHDVCMEARQVRARRSLATSQVNRAAAAAAAAAAVFVVFVFFLSFFLFERTELADDRSIEVATASAKDVWTSVATTKERQSCVVNMYPIVM